MENWQVPSCLTRWAAEPNSPREGHKFTCSPSCDKFGGASWRVNVYRRTHVGLLLMLRQVKSEPGSTSGIWLTPKFNQFKRVTPYPQPWPIAYRVWSTSRNVFVSYIARRGTHRHTDIHHNTIPAPSTDVPIKVQENIVTFRTVKCSLDAAKRGFYRAFNSIFGKIGHNASEEVILQLVSTKCIPILLYGLEVIPLVQCTDLLYFIHEIFWSLV